MANISKAEEWLTEERLALLEGWARDGLNDEQIAHNMGINPRTLYRWKKNNEQICQSIKKGKEVADYIVENALYKRALGYTTVVLEDKLDKDGCVHKDLRREVHVPGDVGAMVFWLKNRKPDKWKDKPQEQSDSKSKKVVIVNDLPK